MDPTIVPSLKKERKKNQEDNLVLFYLLCALADRSEISNELMCLIIVFVFLIYL